MQTEQSARAGTPHTELRAARRRSRTATEFFVTGLALAILLAFSFIGYAVVYRLRVGPGLTSAVPVALVPESSSAELSPTLVATFTPTPTPTLPAPTPVAEPPTPLPEPTLPILAQPTRPVASSPPTRLVIPKIDVDIPVLTVGVKLLERAGRTTAVWADVPNAGGFHETSALPGQPGNTVINGHRDIAGSVFRHLNRVEVGDEIVLYVQDIPFPYRVTETLVVPQTFASAGQRAENQRLIGYMPEERLTLVTCTPVGLATHRLLVIARPPDQAGPDMPEAGSDTQP